MFRFFRSLGGLVRPVFEFPLSRSIQCLVSIQHSDHAFGAQEWQRRVEENPRRIYAFVLASDEHEQFRKSLVAAWTTVDRLSGIGCDVFTFEQSGYLTGLPNTDRAECYRVRDALFNEPDKIILPGLAVFASCTTRDATFISCANLDTAELSALLQQVFNTINSLNRNVVEGDRFDIYEAFRAQYSRNNLRSRAMVAISKISLKDIFSILSGTIKFIR